MCLSGLIFEDRSRLQSYMSMAPGNEIVGDAVA